MIALRLRTLDGCPSLEPLARRWTRRGLPLCWLDSAQGTPGRARFSLLAHTPRTVLALGRSLRRAPGEVPVVQRLRARYQRARAERHIRHDVPGAPFLGGLLGYIAYEAQVDFDPAFPERDGLLPYPRLCFRLADRGVTADHAAGKTHLWTWLPEGQPDPDWAAWEAALLGEPEPDERPLLPWRLDPSAFDDARFRRHVEDVLERIAAGEVYQVNLTEQVPVQAGSDPLALYGRLRRASPSDFSAFLRWPELMVLASSPEEFLTVQDGLATSRPMKGTRPRLGDGPADEAAAEELRGAEKDRAENLMIVDLVRNDLGRVAETGSVSVPELFAVERYATVLQLTSAVTARLGAGQDALAALGALFPPGSMTGAPKVQATRVIRALEPHPRGLYSGCLGAIDWHGNAAFNVVIRTLVGHAAGWSTAVGGGIVADSDPDAEVAEALTKLAGIRRALG